MDTTKETEQYRAIDDPVFADLPMERRELLADTPPVVDDEDIKHIEKILDGIKYKPESYDGEETIMKVEKVEKDYEPSNKRNNRRRSRQLRSKRNRSIIRLRARINE